MYIDVNIIQPALQSSISFQTMFSTPHNINGEHLRAEYVMGLKGELYIKVNKHSPTCWKFI